MSIRNIRRQAGNLQGAPGTTTSAPCYVDSADNKLKIIPAGTGTTVVEVVDASSTQTLTNKTITGLASQVVSGSGATVTLTAAQSGATLLFDKADGIVYTLPAPVVGLNFTFLVKTAITSNSAKVITDAGTTLLLGSVWEAIAAGTGTQFFSAPTTSIAVTQNGTTTGGLIGSALYFTCIDATHWMVDGTLVASGTIATPFANS